MCSSFALSRTTSSSPSPKDCVRLWFFFFFLEEVSGFLSEHETCFIEEPNPMEKYTTQTQMGRDWKCLLNCWTVFISLDRPF